MPLRIQMESFAIEIKLAPHYERAQSVVRTRRVPELLNHGSVTCVNTCSRSTAQMRETVQRRVSPTVRSIASDCCCLARAHGGTREPP
jgi:hypothetical protein